MAGSGMPHQEKSLWKSYTGLISLCLIQDHSMKESEWYDIMKKRKMLRPTLWKLMRGTGPFYKTKEWRNAVRKKLNVCCAIWYKHCINPLRKKTAHMGLFLRTQNWYLLTTEVRPDCIGGSVKECLVGLLNLRGQ